MRATVNSENRRKRALTAPAHYVTLSTEHEHWTSFSSQKCVCIMRIVTQVVTMPEFGKYTIARFDNESEFQWNWSFCELWTLNGSYLISMFFSVFEHYHFIRNLEIVSESEKSKKVIVRENCWKPGRMIHIGPLPKNLFVP